jgi:hypothetical protein
VIESLSCQYIGHREVTELRPKRFNAHYANYELLSDFFPKRKVVERELRDKRREYGLIATMADEKSSTNPTEVVAPEVTPDTPQARPAGWMYKGFKIGKSELWYASPKAQLLLVAFICFLCPGMFNALTGLGGGGQVDPGPQAKANTALYSTFAVVGFFSGSFANRLGVRLTLSFGGIGYCIYAASFLSYSHTQNEGFNVFAGAFLGVCAGLLWTAQGAIMMSYPLESKKGRYISWFWMIFNMGAVIGSLVSFPLPLLFSFLGVFCMSDAIRIASRSRHR